MVKKILESKLKDEKEFLILLFLLIAVILFIIQLKLCSGFYNLLIRSTVATIFLSLYFKAFKSMLYSFWSFTFLITFYFINCISYTWWSWPGLLLVFTMAYFISSPLFYPRVRWWEYDSRYKEDLKVFICGNESEQVGRLTDLRRNAGVIILFRDMEVGKKFDIKIPFHDESFLFKVQIFSKKEYLIGRGISYGVKFIDDSQIVDYKNLKLSWRQELLDKKRLKKLDNFQIF